MTSAGIGRVLSLAEENEFRRRIREAGILTIKAFLIQQERAAAIRSPDRK